MVKLIMGLDGSGKTKTLIDLVREAIDHEQGDVVCIEKSKHLTYDIPYQVRLIRTDDYAVKGNTMLYGFLSGLHAGNYDITHIFIDNFFKLVKDKSDEAVTTFFTWLCSFAEREHIDFVVSVTCDKETAPAILKELSV